MTNMMRVAREWSGKHTLSITCHSYHENITLHVLPLADIIDHNAKNKAPLMI